MPKRATRSFRKRRTNKRPGSNQAPRETAVSSQQYNGPVSMRVFSGGDHTTTLLLTYQTTLVSDAGGVISTVFGNNPSSAGNWADTNTVWGEHRVLAFKVEFFPYNRYSKTTTTCIPVVVDVDRRSATALPNMAAATSRETAKLKSLEDPWKIEAKMKGSEEAQFLAVSSPNSFIWIKTYTSGLTVSTTYGLILVRYLVQFRNVE